MERVLCAALRLDLRSPRREQAAESTLVLGRVMIQQRIRTERNVLEGLASGRSHLNRVCIASDMEHRPGAVHTRLELVHIRCPNFPKLSGNKPSEAEVDREAGEKRQLLNFLAHFNESGSSVNLHCRYDIVVEDVGGNNSVERLPDSFRNTRRWTKCDTARTICSVHIILVFVQENCSEGRCAGPKRVPRNEDIISRMFLREP
mmetsp:Transcript_28310/g.111165  ORF Transcript_28310/g.111165 Transcript_28310/m.111165 type:complete len:203 (+) Transcript_28310:219-827(+)